MCDPRERPGLSRDQGLAVVGVEHFAPEAICQFLEQMSDEFGFGPCVFSPFDPHRDGVGYVTKKVHRFKDGRFEVIPLDYYPSTGLVKLWKEKGLK